MSIKPQHLSNLLKDKRRPSEDLIDRLVYIEHLSTETRSELRQAAKYPSKALANSVIELNDLIQDPAISPDIRARIDQDVSTIVQGWRSYQEAKDHQYNREWKKSMETSANALANIQQMNGRLISYLLDARVAVFLHLAEFDQIRDIYKQAEPFLLQAKDPFIQAYAHMHQGDYHREKSEWKNAEHHYRMAQELFNRLDKQHEVTRCEHKLAIVLLYQGNWKKAQVLLKTCESFFEELYNEYELIKVRYTMAWLYNVSGKRDKAHQYHVQTLRQSQDFKTRQNNEDDYLIGMGVEGIAHDALNRRDIGEEFKNHIEEATTRAKKIGNKRSLGFISLLQARASSYLAQIAQHPDEANALAKQAEDHFAASLEHLGGSHYRYRQAVTLIYHAQHLLTQRAYRKAQNALNQALYITTDISSEYYQAKALALLCQLHYQTNQYEDIETPARDIEMLHSRNTYLDVMARLRFIEASATLAKKNIGGAAPQFAEAFKFAIEFDLQVVNELLYDLEQIVSQLRTQTHLPTAEKQQFRELFIAQCETYASQSPEFGKTKPDWKTTLNKIRLILAPLKSNY